MSSVILLFALLSQLHAVLQNRLEVAVVMAHADASAGCAVSGSPAGSSSHCDA